MVLVNTVPLLPREDQNADRLLIDYFSMPLLDHRGIIPQYGAAKVGSSQLDILSPAHMPDIQYRAESIPAAIAASASHQLPVRDFISGSDALPFYPESPYSLTGVQDEALPPYRYMDGHNITFQHLIQVTRSVSPVCFRGDRLFYDNAQLHEGLSETPPPFHD